MHVRDEKLRSRQGRLADDAFSQMSRQHGLAVFLILARAGAKTEDFSAVVEGEDGNVVVIKRLLDQMRDAQAQFVEIRDVGDLRRDAAHQGELFGAPVLQRHLPKDLQVTGGVRHQTFEEIQFFFAEGRTLAAVHFQDAQQEILGDDWKRQRARGTIGRAMRAIFRAAVWQVSGEGLLHHLWHIQRR